MGTLKGFGLHCDVDDCEEVFFMAGDQSYVCKIATQEGWHVTERRDVCYEVCCPAHAYLTESEPVAQSNAT